eukprot:scaffold109_cov368-Pavlova_lutheri.AAC.9
MAPRRPICFPLVRRSHRFRCPQGGSLAVVCGEDAVHGCVQCHHDICGLHASKGFALVMAGVKRGDRFLVHAIGWTTHVVGPASDRVSFLRTRAPHESHHVIDAVSFSLLVRLSMYGKHFGWEAEVAFVLPAQVIPWSYVPLSDVLFGGTPLLARLPFVVVRHQLQCGPWELFLDLLKQQIPFLPFGLGAGTRHLSMPNTGKRKTVPFVHGVDPAGSKIETRSDRKTSPDRLSPFETGRLSRNLVRVGSQASSGSYPVLNPMRPSHENFVSRRG